MDKLRHTPKDASSFRMKSAAALLSVTGAIAGCNTTSDMPLDQVTVIGDNEKYQQELLANDGANVRLAPGLDGGVIIGKVPVGAKLTNVVVISGDGGNWVKGKCLEMPIKNPLYEYLPRESNDPFAPVVENAACYVNGNLVNE